MHKMTHTGRDGSSSFERAQRLHYPGAIVAENVATGQRSEEEVMTGWMNSPGIC
jgi:uncharacterized protein YkwD